MIPSLFIPPSSRTICRIRDSVDSIIGEVTEIRRDIHRHPEIGRKEVRTAELIRKKLKEYGVDEDTALERFYTSKTGECYADDRTGLYSQSALYIFSMYKREVSSETKGTNDLAFHK